MEESLLTRKSMTSLFTTPTGGRYIFAITPPKIFENG
jgi:hypothetical protein